jgi:hypothetical protein
MAGEMAIYIVQARYTGDAVRGMMNEPEDRKGRRGKLSRAREASSSAIT